ncbi:MAG: FmdB family transcriptional regulator [Opitutales bacterium]
MPIYLYEIVRNDGSAGERFEVEQPMTEPALTHHPLTGQPVRKVLTAPHLASKYTPGRTKSLLETKNVEKAGFTKYERDRLTGRYHKVAGKAPGAPESLEP